MFSHIKMLKHLPYLIKYEYYCIYIQAFTQKKNSNIILPGIKKVKNHHYNDIFWGLQILLWFMWFCYFVQVKTPVDRHKIIKRRLVQERKMNRRTCIYCLLVLILLLVSALIVAGLYIIRTCTCGLYFHTKKMQMLNRN